MMEYLITMAVYLLIVVFFLLRWCDNFAEKFLEKLKENSFSPPPGKVAVLTLKGHPLGEGVQGHIEGYVTDGGTAYALMMFGEDFYRLPVEDMFRDYPMTSEGLPAWCKLWNKHHEALTVAEAI